MPEESITVKAIVRESLPNALYRVEIEAPVRGQAVVHAAGSGTLLRLLPGDPVVVELASFDPTRGRIVGRRA